MLCWLVDIPGWDFGNFTANRVGLFTATTWPVDLVVTALAQFKATLGWQVTPQARQNKGHNAHGGPPSATVGLATRTGIIGAIVLIVIGAVVEKTLHTADTGPVIYHVLGRAKTLLITDPTGRKSPRVSAFLTLALPAVLTSVGVHMQIFFAGGFQLPRLQFRFWLYSYYPLDNGPQGGPQKSLF